MHLRRSSSGLSLRVRDSERSVAVIHRVRTSVRQTEAHWDPRIGAAELAHLKRTLQIRFLSHLLGKHSIQTAPVMQLSQGRLVG
jgi:hypothetical protein